MVASVTLAPARIGVDDGVARRREDLELVEEVAAVLGVVPGPGLSLSAQEKLDLLAFLRALSDPGFLTDPSLGP